MKKSLNVQIDLLKKKLDNRFLISVLAWSADFDKISERENQMIDKTIHEIIFIYKKDDRFDLIFKYSMTESEMQYMTVRSVRKEIHLFTDKNKRLAFQNVWKTIVNDDFYTIICVREENEVEIDKNWIKQNFQTFSKKQNMSESSKKKKKLSTISEKTEENSFQNVVFTDISDLTFLQVMQQEREKKTNYEKSKKIFFQILFL